MWNKYAFRPKKNVYDLQLVMRWWDAVRCLNLKPQGCSEAGSPQI